MSLFCIFAISLAVYWVLLSLISYYIVNKAFKTYRNHPKFDVPDHYQAVMRQDFNKWDESAIIRGCFLRFPFKFSIQLTYIFWVSFTAILHLKFKLPAFFVEFIRIYLGRFSNLVMFELVEHFDWKQKITTPIVIANHTSMMDGNYLGSCFRRLSAISKASVRKVPMFGTFMDYLKCILVDRQSGGRGAIYSQIKTRIEQFEKSNDDSVFPILVFPEGTCSNGRCILSFKNGAFDNLTPITIFSLRYQCKQFHPAQDQINPLYLVFIQLCLNPKLIVKKQIVDAKKGQTVDQYRQRCRDILSQMCNFKKYDTNYNDFLQYQKQLKEILQSRKKQK